MGARPPQRDDATIATHAALFETDDRALCDACGQLVDTEADGSGVGLYVWTRGTEVRYEEPPLCASCSSAIGLSALGRSEIEEEEG